MNSEIKQRFLSSFPWQDHIWHILVSDDFERTRDSVIEEPDIGDDAKTNDPFFHLIYLTYKALGCFCHKTPKYVDVKTYCKQIMQIDGNNLVALTLLVIVHHRTFMEQSVKELSERIRELTNFEKGHDIACLSVIYFWRKKLPLKYVDGWDLLRKMRDGTKPFSKSLMQDEQVNRFVNFHYGLLMFRTASTTRWYKYVEPYFDEGIEVLQALSSTDSPNCARSYVTSIELMALAQNIRSNAYSSGSFSTEIRSEAQPVDEKMLEHAAELAKAWNDGNSMARIGILWRNTTNYKMAEECLRESLSMGCRKYFALTALYYIIYKKWLVKLLKQNWSTLEKERKRLDLQDFYPVVNMLASLYHTPQGDGSFLEEMQELYCMIEKHSEKNFSLPIKAQVQILSGQSTIEEVDEYFLEALRSAWKGSEAFIYRVWGGCCRAVDSPEYQRKYKEMLWNELRSPDRYQGKANSRWDVLHSMIRAEIPSGKDECVKQLKNLGELYFMVNRYGTATCFYNNAHKMDPDGVSILLNLAACYCKTSDFKKGFQFYKDYIHSDLVSRGEKADAIEHYLKEAMQLTLQLAMSPKVNRGLRFSTVNVDYLKCILDLVHMDTVSNNQYTTTASEEVCVVCIKPLFYCQSKPEEKFEKVKLFFKHNFELPVEYAESIIMPNESIIEFWNVLQNALLVFIDISESISSENCRWLNRVLEIAMVDCPTVSQFSNFVVYGNKKVIEGLELHEAVKAFLSKSYIGSRLSCNKMLRAITTRVQHILKPEE